MRVRGTERGLPDAGGTIPQGGGAPPSVIFAGTARLPANASGPNGADALTLQIEAAPPDMQVLAVASNCLTPAADDPLKDAGRANS